MKQLQILLSLLMLGLSSPGQSFEDLSFGTDTTFEAITWNIEWFPKNGQTTVDYVTEIIKALDADLFAIQEVDDISAFEQVVENTGAYEGYLESGYFAGLAYMYKTSTVQINDIYEIYTTSPYWSPFPRSPMVIDLIFMGERIIVINNHFKCCGDGILNLNDPDDEETRRYIASNLLKEYVDENFPDENVIVLGDLNDMLSDNPENNVFQQFFDDEENYLFTDYQIALGNQSGWSYPTWPSHLDHILVTNELFNEFENSGSAVQTIKIDEYLEGGWWEYDQNVSDHRPVGLKLLMIPNLGISGPSLATPSFRNFPNPFSDETTFSFKILNGLGVFEIFDLQGQTVFSEEIPAGKTSITWDGKGFPGGIYMARLLWDNGGQSAALKLILNR